MSSSVTTTATSGPTLTTLTNLSGATTVNGAAQHLAMVLQHTGNMTPSPDPKTANIINLWLDTHLPVSYTFFVFKRSEEDAHVYLFFLKKVFPGSVPFVLVTLLKHKKKCCRRLF